MAPGAVRGFWQPGYSALCSALVPANLSSFPLAQVDDVAGNDVVCTARNNASLDGLLTIFHTERSSDTLQNVQNDLQILSQVQTGQSQTVLSDVGVRTAPSSLGRLHSYQANSVSWRS